MTAMVELGLADLNRAGLVACRRRHMESGGP